MHMQSTLQDTLCNSAAKLMQLLTLGRTGWQDYQLAFALHVARCTVLALQRKPAAINFEAS